LSRRWRGFMLNNSIRGGPDAPANERVREVEYVVRRLRDHETVAHVFVCHPNERIPSLPTTLPSSSNVGARDQLEDLLCVKIRTLQAFIQEDAP
jgi:hypothetical protein